MAQRWEIPLSHRNFPNHSYEGRTVMSKSNRTKLSLTGQAFGRLTVVGPGGRSTSGRHTYWECRCVCGGSKRVDGGNLTAGRTRSCGCLHTESAKSCNVTHGLSDTPEYQVWSGMWRRCTNPNEVRYKRYKHLVPPESWRDFAVFYAEMGPRPSPEHSLERVKNELPYGPGNCKWATSVQQARNTRSNIWVSLGGRRVCLKEACQDTGIGYKLVYGRWKSHGDMLRASNGMFNTEELT